MNRCSVELARHTELTQPRQSRQLNGSIAPGKKKTVPLASRVKTLSPLREPRIKEEENFSISCLTNQCLVIYYGNGIKSEKRIFFIYFTRVQVVSTARILVHLNIAPATRGGRSGNEWPRSRHYARRFDCLMHAADSSRKEMAKSHRVSIVVACSCCFLFSVLVSCHPLHSAYIQYVVLI